MLGERLRELREAIGMTQKQVADVIGVSERVYGFYEAGRFPRESSILLKLAQCFGVSVSHLLDADEVAGIPPEFVVMARKTEDLPKKTRQRVYAILNSTFDKVIELIEDEAEGDTIRGKAQKV